MNSAVFSLTPGPSPRGRGAKENRRKFLLQYLIAALAGRDYPTLRRVIFYTTPFY